MITAGDVGVFHDGGGVSQYHFNQLPNVRFNEERHYYQGADSFEDFFKSKHKVKLASFHVPFPNQNEWMLRLKRVYNHVDHVFVFCSELHCATAEQLRQLDKLKISIYVNGIFRKLFDHAKVYPWMDWFCQPLHFYKELKPTLLEQKLQGGAKDRMFDTLLGAHREHRDFAYFFIRASANKSLYFLTYYNRIDIPLSMSGFNMDEDGLETIQHSELNHSINRVRYYGHELSISQVIPTKIYNQTNYSLIAETNAENDFNFYTEKVTKPLMAGRLFVALAGQHYLKNLRTFGFKTFDSIIDESYDAEPDPKQRWTMAMQQCEWLCQQDPEVILEQVKPIVEHNKNLIFTHDWYGEVSRLLESELLPYVE